MLRGTWGETPEAKHQLKQWNKIDSNLEGLMFKYRKIASFQFKTGMGLIKDVKRITLS